MAALTSAPFVFLFTFSGIFAQSQEKITVRPGDDVTLLCQVPQDAAIEVLMWRRSDLESKEFVFFFRDERPVETDQLESYRSRVSLRDPEMKNGDASVILRNAIVSDTGTYECFVPESNGGRRRRRAADITQTINLLVTEPGHEHAGDAGHGGGGGHGHVGLVAALIVVIAVVCCTGLFLVWLKKRSLKKKSESPAADGADVQISLNP